MRDEEATVELHLYEAPLGAEGSDLVRAITNTEFATQDWSPNTSYREEWTRDQSVFALVCLEAGTTAQDHITDLTIGDEACPDGYTYEAEEDGCYTEFTSGGDI